MKGMDSPWRMIILIISTCLLSSFIASGQIRQKQFEKNKHLDGQLCKLSNEVTFGDIINLVHCGWCCLANDNCSSFFYNQEGHLCVTSPHILNVGPDDIVCEASVSMRYYLPIEESQWIAQVLSFSSEFISANNRWLAQQLIGDPVFNNYSWCPENKTSDQEFLELFYNDEAYITQINIYLDTKFNGVEKTVETVKRRSQDGSWVDLLGAITYQEALWTFLPATHSMSQAIRVEFNNTANTWLCVNSIELRGRIP